MLSRIATCKLLQDCDLDFRRAGRSLPARLRSWLRGHMEIRQKCGYFTTLPSPSGYASARRPATPSAAKAAARN